MPFFDGFEVDRNKHNNEAGSGGEGGNPSDLDPNTSDQSDEEYSVRISCGRTKIDRSLAENLVVTLPDIDQHIFPVRQADLQKHMERFPGVPLACARFIQQHSFGNTHRMTENLKKAGHTPTILVEDQSRYSITVIPDTTRIDVKGSCFPSSGHGASGVSPPNTQIEMLIKRWSGDFGSGIREIRIPLYQDNTFTAHVFATGVRQASAILTQLQNVQSQNDQSLQHDQSFRETRSQGHEAGWSISIESCQPHKITAEHWRDIISVAGSHALHEDPGFVVGPPNLNDARTFSEPRGANARRRPKRQRADKSSDGDSESDKLNDDPDGTGEASIYVTNRMNRTVMSVAAFFDACTRMVQKHGFLGIFIYAAYGFQCPFTRQKYSFPRTNVVPSDLPEWLEEMQRKCPIFRASFGLNFRYANVEKPSQSWMIFFGQDRKTSAPRKEQGSSRRQDRKDIHVNLIEDAELFALTPQSVEHRKTFFQIYKALIAARPQNGFANFEDCKTRVPGLCPDVLQHLRKQGVGFSDPFPSPRERRMEKFLRNRARCEEPDIRGGKRDSRRAEEPKTPTSEEGGNTEEIR